MGTRGQSDCNLCRPTLAAAREFANNPTPLPSFFVVGPPRTGTTWLHGVLADRAVLPSPTKETRFFDTHFHRGLRWYQTRFPAVGTGPVGEIAPTYFASSKARERLAQVIPDAKVICIFRNPVERVLSLYRLKRAYGMIPWSFEQAITNDPELTESSKYASKLREWRSSMGAENILATLYDDLRDRPQDYINDLADFTGLPRFALTSEQIKMVHSSEKMTEPRNYYRTRGATMMAEWFKVRRLDGVVAAVKKSPLMRLFIGGGQAFAELPREVARQLYERFRPEVEELEHLLDRDLSAWKGASTEASAA